MPGGFCVDDRLERHEAKHVCLSKAALAKHRLIVVWKRHLVAEQPDATRPKANSATKSRNVRYSLIIRCRRKSTLPPSHRAVRQAIGSLVFFPVRPFMHRCDQGMQLFHTERLAKRSTFEPELIARRRVAPRRKHYPDTWMALASRP